MTEVQRRVWSRPLVAHGLGVVALLLLYGLLTATHTGPDANIGAGVVGLLILVLGLPWTLPTLLGAGAPATSPLPHFGWAVLNVALHAVLRLVVIRRRTGR